MGTVRVTSPEGSTPFGPPRPGLVARTVDSARGTIVETVLDDGALRTTTLTRRGETNVFDASDSEKTFSGTLTFSGTPWAWTGWTYALSMTDGSGTIEGTATIDDATLQTEKYFVSPDGERRARIVDDMKVIDKDEYEKKRNELVQKGSATSPSAAVMVASQPAPGRRCTLRAIHLGGSPLGPPPWLPI